MPPSQPLNWGQKSFALAAPMLVRTRFFPALAGCCCGNNNQYNQRREGGLPSSRHHRPGIYAIEVCRQACAAGKRARAARVAEAMGILVSKPGMQHDRDGP